MTQPLRTPRDPSHVMRCLNTWTVPSFYVNLSEIEVLHGSRKGRTCVPSGHGGLRDGRVLQNRTPLPMPWSKTKTDLKECGFVRAKCQPSVRHSHSTLYPLAKSKARNSSALGSLEVIAPPI